MNLFDPVQRKVFMEIHSGLPRESCGSFESTMRALALAKERLPQFPNVADFACGPGSSAIPLAEALPGANILAVDLHEPFVIEARRRAHAAGVSERLKAEVADMMNPPIDDYSLDMIWCEGGIYNIGVERGLSCWRRLLKPGGIVVFNEPIWLTEEAERPNSLANFWSAYPAMSEDAGVSVVVHSVGYRIVGAFNLPDSDWWEEYYNCIESKIEGIAQQYQNDPNALEPVLATQREIEMRRKFPEHYNYRFYCTQVETA